MRLLILVCWIAVAAIAAEKDEWVWNDDSQTTQKDGRANGPRYQIHEDHDSGEDYDDEGSFGGFRPQHGGPFGPNSRPIRPNYPGNKDVLVGPGGPSGLINRPHYPGQGQGQGHGHGHGQGHGNIDSGFIPSWIRDDPRYRDYDTCKCRYSFNCPANSLKFGSCSQNKKYCCFNSRKYPGLVSENLGGGSRPFYPGAPNKFGPVGFAPNYQGNRRPHGNFYPGDRNPYGNYHSSSSYGNPYDGSPYAGNGDDQFDFYARSLGKNQTATKEAEAHPE